MARRIVEGGFPLTLWARRPQSLRPPQHGGLGGTTPADLAEASSIVCLCVTGDEDVVEVVEGPGGVLSGLAPGGILLVHSTVHPETCIRLDRFGIGEGHHRARRSREWRRTGGCARHAARDGRRRRAGLDRARPVLTTFGNPILHLGGVGAGQTAKLVNNLVFTAQIALSLEAFALAGGLGLDTDAMGPVFERGSGASRAATMLSARGFDLGGLGRVAGPLLRKDVDLITDVARRRQMTAPASRPHTRRTGSHRLHDTAEEAS